MLLINAWKIMTLNLNYYSFYLQIYTADGVVNRVDGCATFCSEHATKRDV